MENIFYLVKSTFHYHKCSLTQFDIVNVEEPLPPYSLVVKLDLKFNVKVLKILR